MVLHVRQSDDELAILRALSRRFPTLDTALAELARLSAILTLPKGTVHVISDVHGEDAKLRHVINNASGTLRPLVERLVADRLTPVELQEFLTLIFYPKELIDYITPTLPDMEQRRTYCKRVLLLLFEIIRTVARDYSAAHALRAFPVEYRDLFQELLYERSSDWWEQYTDAIVGALLVQGQAAQLIRKVVRAVRNLAIDELIIAGDLWDRGPRGDRVVDYLRRQPNVSFTWGNHDMSWLGACLGQEALIACVLRISLRYRRLFQLEEGYGITLSPLETLVREAYRDDPAECFVPRMKGTREVRLLSRMQKAAAIMQFKLEGQTIERNPEFGLGHRRLLHQIDPRSGMITIDGKTWPLKDRHFPTINPERPYALSPEEATCVSRLRQSFLTSPRLWDHMKFMVEHGGMYLVRDDHLIFHGCVPVEENGDFQSMPIDGDALQGRELFHAIERVVNRALERKAQKDLDLLWYLWSGPKSPLFGKDRIVTLENDLIAEASTHVETKNPYFNLLHEPAFCERILQEFGVDPGNGLIVNGHVPVKIERGESPLKRSGKAITIDGAFSEAYGDHGYTLVLEPQRTLLARHHHFESVEAAVRQGVDIIPTIEVVREWSRARRVEDTERGDQIRADIRLLERLIKAYQTNVIRQGEA